MQTPASPRALQDIVQHAAAHETPLRIVGAGTWLDGGGPFVSDSRVSLRALAGVVAYEPGDLVITVGAGTSLAELDAATVPHGQRLAAWPFGTAGQVNDSTVGACIATAAPAPLALSDLTMRDLVLGVTALTGTGEFTRAGGRVVKNVAGFDLVRMHTGAFGTLGVITEVTVRLHAIPPVDAIVVGTLEAPLATALPTLVANRAPLPMLLQLEPGRAPELWARIAGNTARAAALTNRLMALGVTSVTHAANADTLRAVVSSATVVRVRAPLSDAAPLVLAAQSVFADATLQYDPSRGSLRIVTHTSDEPLTARLSRLLTHAAAAGAIHAPSVVVEQGRTAARTRNALETALKHTMDPHDVLNRHEPS